jgi:rhodanese-related sulfurtransferase
VRRPVLWIVAAAAVLVAAGAAGWAVRRPTAAVTAMPNPYHLSPRDELRLLRYFGDASRHDAYQISAATLATWLAEKKPVVIIDVRQPFGPDGFVEGHVPGAYDIPVQDFGRELTATHRYTAVVDTYWGDGTRIVPAKIQFFPLPRHEPIVVMCYDGMGGEMTPALLRLLGYQAYGLRWGLSSWSQALDVWPSPGSVNPYPVAVGGSAAPTGAPLLGDDQLSPGSAAQVAPLFHALDYSYPPGYGRPWTIEASALETALNSPDPPQVIDLRSPKAYAAGHIPGSINIPFADLGADINAISRQRTVVLASATLQRAAQACLVLRLLGIQCFVLQQGLATWNPEFAPPPPVTAHYPIAVGGPAS